MHTTENTTIVVTLRHESELRRAVIGRFRLALAADAFAWPPTADAGRRLRSRDPSGRTTWASGLPEDVMRALRRPPEDRDVVEATAVREYLIFSNPAVAERYREVQLLETERGLRRRVDSSCGDGGFGGAGADAHPAARQLDGRVGADRRAGDSAIPRRARHRRASARRASISRTGWWHATIR